MKRFLCSAGLSMISTLALSAEPVPVEAPSVEAGSARWSGTYLGLHAGYSWGHSTSSITGYPAPWAGADPAVPASYGINSSGSLGGIQIGHNLQIDNTVIGIEADIGVSSISGSASRSGNISASGTPFTFSEKQRIETFNTLRGRIGFVPVDRLMVYATGGVAQGKVTTSTNLSFPTVRYTGSDSNWKVGWILGVGAEYALTDRLSAKLEYLHYDLGRATAVGYRTPANASFNTHTDFSLNGDIVRAGLNYQFDGKGTSSPDTGFDASQWQRAVQTEFGMRYWYSNGKTAKDLYDTTGSARVSRLTYSDLGAQSGELFARVDHSTGFFVKGYVGTGKVTKGHLKDEDFQPFIDPYSSTSSSQKNGTIGYASADIGCNFLAQPEYRLGVFAGYHYYHEVVNAYGCTQTATSTAICTPAIPTSTLVITNDSKWYSTRLGLAGDVMLTKTLKFAAEAAWLPRTRLDTRDSHWLRIGSPGGFAGSIPEDGVGHNGIQLESTLTYQVSPSFSLGMGARYWRAETKGDTHFEGMIIGGGGSPQPVKYKMERYGSFLQAAFKF